MKIKGIEGMSPDLLRHEIERGGRFIVYQYCVSILVLTFKRVSSIHFVKAGESVVGRGAIFSLVSLVCGWWGIPWGPIWTVSTVFGNCRGGRDVTAEVVRALSAKAA